MKRLLTYIPYIYLTVATIVIICLFLLLYGFSSDSLSAVAAIAAATAAIFSYLLSRDIQRANKLRDSCHLLARRDFSKDNFKFEFAIINQGPGLCFIKSISVTLGSFTESIDDLTYLMILNKFEGNTGMDVTSPMVSLPISLRPGQELILFSAMPSFNNRSLIKDREELVRNAIRNLTFFIEFEDIHKVKSTWPMK